jgi:hypothetical protein
VPVNSGGVNAHRISYDTMRILLIQIPSTLITYPPIAIEFQKNDTKVRRNFHSHNTFVKKGIIPPDRTHRSPCVHPLIDLGDFPATYIICPYHPEVIQSCSMPLLELSSWSVSLNYGFAFYWMVMTFELSVPRNDDFLIFKELMQR